MGFIQHLLSLLKPTPPVDAAELRLEFKQRYRDFKALVAANNDALEIMTELEQVQQGRQPFGMAYLRGRCAAVANHVRHIIHRLERLAPNRYQGLTIQFERITAEIVSVGSISAEEKKAILREYYESALARNYMSQGGEDYAREMLINSLGERKARSIMSRSRGMGESNYFGLINNVDPPSIANFLKNEHPQTIALVLSTLPTDQAGQILVHLPEEVRRSMEAWAGCVAGMARIEDYVAMMREAGFREVEVVSETPYSPGREDPAAGAIVSATFRAIR